MANLILSSSFFLMKINKSKESKPLLKVYLCFEKSQKKNISNTSNRLSHLDIYIYIYIYIHFKT
jgi:hypothetical protein